ncbi:MAG: efflux RND transporter permease subunit [Gammaproteobacteria bacterium]|nr:efflux RND transporter permease subunit [Gammaproteobacteria bacterium]
MLNKIVDFSLRYKVLVLAAFALVIFLGVRAWQKVPLDAFPDVTPVQVSVYTESPGLASEDVEKLLTFPIETAVAGLPGVQEIRSVSLFGLSYVSVYFRDDMDIYFARRLVSEKLLEAKARIPQGYGEPVLGPNTSGLGQVFWYTIEAADKKLSEMDLRTLQDWSVRLVLRTTPGVDDVISWGGHEKQYQALIDPNKLIKYGLTFKEVMVAIDLNNRQVGGQYVNLGREQYLVRGLGLVADTRDIGNIVITQRESTPVFVRDVAEVKEAPRLRTGAITRDGKEVVLGMALARTGENAQNVVEAVKEKLAVVKASLPDGVSLRQVYDRTELIGKAIAMADRAMIEGALLVIAVLFLFLGEVRSALIVVVAIPMARLIAFIFMDEYGVSANLMSLGGLIVGLGMTIDGPVVLVENAFRMLSHHAGKTVNRSQVVLEAAREVMNPIAFGVLIIIVVFLPLFALTGLEGKLFKPLALNMTFAMIGSLILTVTLIPVLAALGLRAKREREPFIVAWLRQRYTPLLQWVLDHKRPVTIGSALLFAGSLSLFPFLGKEFMPTLQEQAIMFRVTSIPSTSLEESVRISEGIEQALKAFPQVKYSLALIGRPEKLETVDVNYMEILVDLKPQEQWPKKISYQALTRKMQEAAEQAAPNAVIAATQPIQMRVEELISGVRATLAAKIYGEDLATLGRLAAEVKAAIETVPGAADLSLEANIGKPQMVVRVNREAAARLGLNADDILEVVQAGIGGKAVSTLIDGMKRFDIQVWLAPGFRNSVEAINNIPIRTPGGALVPLSRVASVELGEGYSFVRREQLQRYAVAQMDVQGRDVDGFVKEAEAAIKQKVKLPAGYWIEWGGAFENQQRAMAKLAVIVPLTIGLIFILLYTAFNSVKYATLIIANVPFAAIGGILSLFASGQYLSVPAAVGFIAVFGVAMLNGIVLISFLNGLRQQGTGIRETVVSGATLRLRPVLMTALVEILGLIPFLLATGVGSEILRPLATVVVGGLFTSTALTLLLLPLMYEWLENRAERRGRTEA